MTVTGPVKATLRAACRPAIDGPSRRGLGPVAFRRFRGFEVRRPQGRKKVPLPQSPKGAEDSSDVERPWAVVLRQLISGMDSGHWRTSPCNVTLPGRGTVAPRRNLFVDVQSVRFESGQACEEAHQSQLPVTPDLPHAVCGLLLNSAKPCLPVAHACEHSLWLCHTYPPR